mmetsp:Transcript_56348/g.138299  ORF Transcript_56348/g.138299 Transcript_56348/m.138299 type:complete len:220 (-) Transcript_56348:170-829(-)
MFPGLPQAAPSTGSIGLRCFPPEENGRDQVPSRVLGQEVLGVRSGVLTKRMRQIRDLELHPVRSDQGTAGPRRVRHDARRRRRWCHDPGLPQRGPVVWGEIYRRASGSGVQGPRAAHGAHPVLPRDHAEGAGADHAQVRPRCAVPNDTALLQPHGRGQACKDAARRVLAQPHRRAAVPRLRVHSATVPQRAGQGLQGGRVLLCGPRKGEHRGEAHDAQA